MKLNKRITTLTMSIFVCCLLAACTSPTSYDVILRGGNIYDGSGEKPYIGDVAFDGDRIAAIGDIGKATAPVEIDVTGQAVAPGFVNMMSWANESLIEDGRSQSDIRQGVTLEIMGEGSSMGPLNDDMKAAMAQQQGDIRYDVEWTTLDGVPRVSRTTRRLTKRCIVYRRGHTAKIRHWV